MYQKINHPEMLARMNHQSANPVVVLIEIEEDIGKEVKDDKIDVI